MSNETPQDDAAALLLYELTVVVHEEIGMTDHLATQFAEAITRGLRRRLPAQDLYIPAPDKRDRDAAVRREFNGRNVDEVCRRHDIGKTTLYRILGTR